MIAQDTGGAILGPARADLYFGTGDEAGRRAGRIRQSGGFVMLVPRELDLVAAGARMPLPLPAPPPEKRLARTAPPAAPVAAPAAAPAAAAPAGPPATPHLPRP
jgi:membrane-bound lytic murein transglycosylase A